MTSETRVFQKSIVLLTYEYFVEKNECLIF